MKNSIYKGTKIQETDSNVVYESIQQKDTNDLPSFDKQVQTFSELGITDWEQLYGILANEKIKATVQAALQ